MIGKSYSSERYRSKETEGKNRNTTTGEPILLYQELPQRNWRLKRVTF
jgi:hypothetical protein